MTSPIDGPIIENPLHGQRIHFLKTVPETNGELVGYDSVPASRYSPAIELHPMIGATVEEKEKEFIVDWKG